MKTIIRLQGFQLGQANTELEQVEVNLVEIYLFKPRHIANQHSPRAKPLMSTQQSAVYKVSKSKHIFNLIYCLFYVCVVTEVD